MSSLSAIIIAKNAAEKIERTLKSVAFSDEVIVVVDSATADRTADIARRRGAKVFIKDWEGYGAQKNFGLKQAVGDWVLFVDDDEEVTPKLAAEIKKVVYSHNSHAYSRHSHRPDIYWIRVVTSFLGKPLTHVYGHNPRLFKKKTAAWTDDLVHEQVSLVDGTRIQLGDKYSGLITTPLLHHSHPTISSYLNKMHRYTTLDAKEMAKTGKHRSGRSVKPTLLLPPYLAFRQFIKLYFYRRGVQDGWAGFLWCLLSAYYEYEMGKKYLTIANS